MVDPKLIKKLRRKFGMDRLPAELGRGTGQPRASKGRYWVRKKEAGGYSAPLELPLAPGLSILVKDGTPCEVGWDVNDRQVIYPAGGQELSTAGVNALTANPLDRVIYDPVKSTDFPPFLCKRHGNPVTNPLMVIVYVPPVILDDAVILPSVLSADLTGAVPGAGLKCYAVIFWLDDNSLELQVSTPIGIEDPLGDADLWEAIGASSPGSRPIWAWELADDQTVLSEDPTKNLDLRQFINAPNSGGGGGMTSFNLDADSGTPAEIGDGETATIAGGTGIATSISGNTVTVDVVYETIQDMIASFLSAGANISLSYNDAGNALSIAVTGLDSGDLSDFAEAVDDRVAALLVAGTGITITYNDGSNTLTIALATDHIGLSEYIDLTEWASPTSPAANKVRIFSQDFNGVTVTKMRLSDDTEIIIGSGRYFVARNPGSTITKGQLVRYTGSSHAGTTLPLVALADADSPSTMPVDGIALDTAAFNGTLRVVTEGYAVMDTTGFSDGNNIFASGTAGGWATAAPSFPTVSQRVGIVVLGGLTSGLVYIFPRQADGLITRVLNTTLSIGGTAPGAIVEFWSNSGSNRGRLSWTPTGAPRTLTLPDTTATLAPFSLHTVAPTVNDDSGDALVVGHRWINTSSSKEYVLTDNTLGAAVWIETTAGSLISQTELDFGTDPIRHKQFSVSDANALTTHKFIMQQSAAAPTGRDQDENEFAAFAVRCVCTVNGTITVYADSLLGPVTGKYKFNYMFA